jgi:hypothetical protein
VLPPPIHEHLGQRAPTGSLARVAIENGAKAFWLIHPKSRDERIMHTLQWWAKNLMINRGRWAISALEVPQPSRFFAALISRLPRVDMPVPTSGAGGVGVIAAALRVHQDRTVDASVHQDRADDTSRHWAT